MHKSITHVTYKGGARTRRSATAIVAELLEENFAAVQGPVLIAVGGPGGTGKSTFSRELARCLLHASVLTLDDYKTPREVRHARNLLGAHPAANRIELLREHLLLARAKKPFEKPVYNNATGHADSTERFEPSRIVVLDGEISTYPEVRDLVDFSIFIDSDWKTQLATRVSRDITERGYSREKAVHTFLQSNLIEFEKFGAGSKSWADMHLHCRDDYRLVIESVSEDLYQRFDTILQKDFAAVDLSGLVVAVTTPFDSSLAIREQSFIEHLEMLAAAGVKRILVNGTTAEFFSLTPQERKITLEIARQYFPGVIILHSGSDSLAMTMDEAKRGEDFGADAVVALPPYYFADAPQEGLIEYFNTIGQNLEIPFLLYNFPRHTQNPLTPEILRRVEHFGIKDSARDFSLIEHTPHYFVGGDKHILDAYAKGACGWVSAQANHCPGMYVKLGQALVQKDGERAGDLQREIAEAYDSPSGGSNISTIKQVLAEKLPGYPANVRPPLR
ncbi:MAG: dihydrodipicolinate synthase family protein [Verrucomicrobia bacterium]|nr:dihydrodipicolinate synthase family protein [Verrucomicrobiota bacterium]